MNWLTNLLPWMRPRPAAAPALPVVQPAAVEGNIMEELLALLGEVDKVSALVNPIMLLFHAIAQGIQTVNPTAPGVVKLDKAATLVGVFMPKVVEVLGDQNVRTAISSVVDLSKMPGGALDKINAAAAVAGNIATAITSVQKDLSGDSPQGG